MGFLLRRNHLFLFAVLALQGQASAQTIVNAYAEVSGISGTTLTISNVNEVNDVFVVGEDLIIMQMQDDVIGANTNDDVAFGNISDIGSAGLYEKATLLSVNRPGGILTSVEVTSTLTNTYNTDANSSVQIISFPESTNFSTVDDLTALDWDGSIGGVLAMEVTNTLTLNHNINLDGVGFRGGAVNPGNETGSTCISNVYRTDLAEFGRKGEGVYKNNTAIYTASRAKIASGGGGGSRHNSGGGGGGNFTAGGVGGPGYNEGDPTGGCADAPGDVGTGAGGHGGTDLSDHVSGDRIFMGGGGGGGQQDNAAGDAEAGGDGGGIIIIKAATVEVPSGTGVTITANGIGFAGNDSGLDGGAGGGAGGSIVFQVNTWTLTSDLDTEARGGEGQSVDWTDPHGGGGGGGKGVTIFSGVAPIGDPNFSIDNSQGSGGANGTNPGAGSADEGGTVPDNPAYDPDGDGVIESEEGPLPVELLYWEGKNLERYNQLNWATVSELNNDYFTIERSEDGVRWQSLKDLSGQGTSNDTHEYEYKDYEDVQTPWYYRLKQTDYDGKEETFDVILIDRTPLQVSALVFPNPSSGQFAVQLSPDAHADDLSWVLMDMEGRLIRMTYTIQGSKVVFDLSGYAKGQYFLKMSDHSSVQTLKVLLK